MALVSWAVSNNNFVATKLLIKYGADPKQTMPGTTILLTGKYFMTGTQEFTYSDSLIFSDDPLNNVTPDIYLAGFIQYSARPKEIKE